MADMTPFLTTAEQLIEELGELREQRKKIEESEERRKEKLRAIMAEKKVDTIKATNFEARIEKRESTDFSRGAIEKAFGHDTLVDLEKTLPKKTTESLVIRAAKKAVEDEPGKPSKAEEIHKFFTKGK